MTSSTLVLSDTRMVDHDMGPHHPESPARLQTILGYLDAKPISGVTHDTPKPATAEAIGRVHDPAYVARIEEVRGRRVRLDPDTVTSEGSVDAAFLAAGTAIDLVTRIAEGAAPNGFALVRPPGHHAEREHAMGFCVFNNIAVAAEHLRHAYSFQRVLIVDWDVHHGNGTQHAFYDRDDVLVFNTHRFPFYPGSGASHETGSGPGEGYTVNVPMAAGLVDADFALALEEVLVPVAEAFRPDFVLVSAGFDAHRDDPLGDQQVSDDGFADLTGVVKRIAERHAEGRLAMLLEGGYDLGALARSVHGCVSVLAGETPPMMRAAPTKGGLVATREAQHAARRHWSHVPVMRS